MPAGKRPPSDDAVSKQPMAPNRSLEGAWPVLHALTMKLFPYNYHIGFPLSWHPSLFGTPFFRNNLVTSRRLTTRVRPFYVLGSYKFSHSLFLNDAIPNSNNKFIFLNLGKYFLINVLMQKEQLKISGAAQTRQTEKLQLRTKPSQKKHPPLNS
ncbi:hypothetical protein L798_02313 [Zootermopsis nevadensis]|uniref:Uncharacterized protein n=1 Tax=Zootermopsis nevadensis TaxID=136037 RepID=A0A067RHN2_ZOONE|nr:hypothetical protein L798_02313 [Zootermopsis nevadensis]